ncbi:MAG: sigma 54-interacting transcriptional regulator [Candidatus Babeliales bacterium]
MNFLADIESIIGNHFFVLITIISSLLLKLLLIILTNSQLVNTRETKLLRFLLLIILGSNILSDISWIQELLQSMSILTINPHIKIFIGRIAWGCVSIQYQGLALFLEILATHKLKLNIHQKLSCILTTIFMIFPTGAAFFYFNHPGPLQLIFFINHIALAYYALFLLPYTLSITLRKIKTEQLPHILVKQLKIMYCLIIPHLISDIVQSFPLRLHELNWATNSYALVALTAILLPIGLFYCARKIMGLRFLNLHSKVHALPKVDFIDNFKLILEQLDNAVSTHELELITQSFFKEAFAIPFKKTKLYLRPFEAPYQPQERHYNTHEKVETFVNTNEQAATDTFKKMEILIYDEINFSHFYDQAVTNKKLLTFLTNIKADIFLPIYEKNTLLAYVIVERDARNKELYNSAEQSEMAMFAGYLQKTICLLYKQSIELLIEQNNCLTQKQEVLKKELHLRHQEKNQYQEAVQSFLYKDTNQIGLIFYKNNRFTFGNQAAKNFIPIDINTEVGHPLTQKIKGATKQVADFRSPQTVFSKDEKGDTITLAIIPHLEPDSVVIVVSYADIPTLLKQKISLLKDPNQWDYLLYLETTQSGRLINQLIPGNTHLLLNFKIKFLQAALSRKAVLLDVAQEDVIPMGELLHQISLREELQVFNLKGISDTLTMATKLFGINQLFGTKTNEQEILAKLDQHGTLFITDIHLLNLTCQEYLAEFIRYGSYRVYKSEERKRSNVRIICSSNQDLARLVKENKFSKALFEELQSVNLSMPPLASLSETELHTLADGFSEQTLATNAFKNLLILTEKDKNKITKEQPASLQELNKYVTQILMKKAEKKNIQEETTTFGPVYETENTELLRAARLGKSALKDKKIMTMLWDKFEKNQNKIAEFLGVNRSTIHRRCKLYNLI